MNLKLIIEKLNIHYEVTKLEDLGFSYSDSGYMQSISIWINSCEVCLWMSKEWKIITEDSLFQLIIEELNFIGKNMLVVSSVLSDISYEMVEDESVDDNVEDKWNLNRVNKMFNNDDSDGII